MVGRVLTGSLYALGVCLFYLGAAPLIRRLGRKNPKILLYHDCAALETAYTADLNCTTSPSTLRTHLEYIKKHYNLVDLESIVVGNAPEQAVAITFDDGYSSVYDNAFPILKDVEAPATIYLISSVIDNESLVWVNELNFFLRDGGRAAILTVSKYFSISNSVAVEEIIRHCRLNYDAEKMHLLLEELRLLLNRPIADHSAEANLYLSWDQIDEMLDSNITFGNHSRTHPNMELLTEEDQLVEIEGAQMDLEKRIPSVRAFAHPFGHKGRSTATLVMNAGLASAADVGGYNAPVYARALGRTHLANESIVGLFSRIEVVEPLKGILRRRMSAL